MTSEKLVKNNEQRWITIAYLPKSISKKLFSTSKWGGCIQVRIATQWKNSTGQCRPGHLPRAAKSAKFWLRGPPIFILLRAGCSCLGPALPGGPENTDEGSLIEIKILKHRIVPNEVGVWLHLSKNLYGWGAWMWGIRWYLCREVGSQLKKWGGQTPGTRRSW